MPRNGLSQGYRPSSATRPVLAKSATLVSGICCFTTSATVLSTSRKECLAREAREQATAFSPENPGEPLIPKPGENPIFVAGCRPQRVRN
jgi:hypothetical protein